MIFDKSRIVDLLLLPEPVEGPVLIFEPKPSKLAKHCSDAQMRNRAFAGRPQLRLPMNIVLSVLPVLVKSLKQGNMIFLVQVNTDFSKFAA